MMLSRKKSLAPVSENSEISFEGSQLIVCARSQVDEPVI